MVTVKEIRALLGSDVDSIGRTKEGAVIVRKGFFYRNGMDSYKFAKQINDKLVAANITAKVVQDGEKYAAFRGSATVAQSSHWYAVIA
jgi:hypothetical protein